MAVFQEMANYEEERVKLTDRQLSKLKYPTKSNNRATLRTTKKKFQDKELPQKIFLTTK